MALGLFDRRGGLARDPLSSDDILTDFYRPERRPNAPEQPEEEPKRQRPTHYKVVCISLYNQDIAHLEEMVAELKRRGHTKANKSQLIRAALAQVDLGKIPKAF